MNKSLLVHGVWLMAAIASFAIGSKFFPASGEAGDPGATNLRGNANGPGRKGPGASKEAGSPQAGARSGPGARGGVRSGGKASVVLSEEDIAALGKKFRDSASPIERRLAFSRLLEGLTPENALEVREQIAHMNHRSPEFREFHYAWGAIAGTEAVMFGADTKEDDMNPALAGWASADPNAALAWFKGLDIENDSRFDNVTKDRKIPAEALRHGLLRGLVQGLADTDPDTATQFVSELAADGQKGSEGFMHMIVGAVMRTDAPGDAAQWAENLPSGEIRTQAMVRLADQYVDRDLQAAVAWAEKLGGELEHAGVIAEVGANWAHRDPQAAVTWLSEMPAGHGQSAGMNRALGAWAGKDPTAAGEYLKAMPASQLRDAAIVGYSKRVAWEDPRAAMDWAQTIAAPEERIEAVVGVARAWRHKDAPGIAEWIRNTDLPEEVRKAIQSQPKRDRGRD